LSLLLPVNTPSLDKIIDNDNFAFELNMGLNLPFAAKPTLYKNKDGGYDPQEAFTELPTKNGVVIQKAILRQSENEMYLASNGEEQFVSGKPLSSMDHLVYMALMDLAYHRMGKCKNLDGRITPNRVYFLGTEICKLIGKSQNQETYIKKSINNLFAQQIAFSTFIQKFENDELLRATEQKTTKLIVARGFVNGGFYDENGKLIKSRAVQYIDLEEGVAQGILNESQHATISKSVINKLKVNAEVRLMTFIQSKKKYFGNAQEFVISIKELAHQINIQNKRDKDLVYWVKHYLEPCSKAANFTYVLDYPKNKQRMGYVYINLKPTRLIAFTHDDPHSIYEILLLMYPELVEFFISEKIERGFITQILTDSNKKWKIERDKLGKSTQCTFKGKILDPAEFVFDCLLFQISKGYQITKSFMAVYRVMLDKLINDEVIYPDEYRVFVRDKFKDEKQKEVNQRIKKTKETDQEIKEYRNRLVRVQFEQYYRFRVENNRNVKSKLKSYLIKKGLIEGTNFETLDFQDMKNKCFELYRSTDLDHIINSMDNSSSKILQ